MKNRNAAFPPQPARHSTTHKGRVRGESHHPLREVVDRCVLAPDLQIDLSKVA